MRTISPKQAQAQVARSLKSTKYPAIFPLHSSAVGAMLDLQQAVGNRAVLRLLNTNPEGVRTGLDPPASMRTAQDVQGFAGRAALSVQREPAADAQEARSFVDGVMWLMSNSIRAYRRDEHIKQPERHPNTLREDLEVMRRWFLAARTRLRQELTNDRELRDKLSYVYRIYVYTAIEAFERKLQQPSRKLYQEHKDAIHKLAGPPPTSGQTAPTQPATPSAQTGPIPAFERTANTVTINADSAPRFSVNIAATLGSPHIDPQFDPQIDIDFQTSAGGTEVPGSRNITSIGLKVTTNITKVRFGLGRPNAAHRKAISEMVAIIRDHEQKHRAIIEEEATKALTAAQSFVGTGNTAQAERALTKDLECATNKRHEALDAVEGLLTATEQPDGSVQLTRSPSGAKYPCPP